MASDPLRGLDAAALSTPAGGGGRRRPVASGVSDPTLARARELQRQADEAEQRAAQARAERDRLIRRLRAEDPGQWSYGRLAAALGVSRELIAIICRRAD